MGWFESKKVKVDVKRMEAEKDVDGLLKALGDEDWNVRGTTAEALGKIADVRAVEPLIKALGDENVRWAAKEALRELGREVE